MINDCLYTQKGVNWDLDDACLPTIMIVRWLSITDISQTLTWFNHFFLDRYSERCSSVTVERRLLLLLLRLVVTICDSVDDLLEVTPILSTWLLLLLLLLLILLLLDCARLLSTNTHDDIELQRLTSWVYNGLH